MTTFKITAPSPVSGDVRFGPHVLGFSKGVALVQELPDGVRRYMSRTGYQIEEQSDGSPSSEAFDPSAHNVDGEDGVLAYLQAADDEERERVLVAEKDGKARKTVLEWEPEEQEPENPDADDDDEGTTPETPAGDADELL